MCNLYSITRNQEAIRRLFQVTRGLTDNLPALPAVYPDTMAPVVRVARDGERELTMMRWGFPPPPNLGNAPVTNVRNLKSPYLARMAQGRMALSRAGNLILRMDRQPAEGNPLVCARRMPAAFCLCGDLAAWTGEGEDETGEHQLLAFLTSESNDIVRPVQAKAMPVLLTMAEGWDTWITGSVELAIALQMPLANEMICIVATGEKSEQAPVDELRCRCLHRLSLISNRRRTLLEEGDASEKRH